MRRVFLAALGTLVCWAALSAAQRPAFHANTDLVTVYATVVDREGRLVTDLTADDFEVYDNGRRQPLTLFAADSQPVTLVMMLDRSGSVTAHNELVQSAAESLVEHLLPEDRARIGSFSRRVEMFPYDFTHDRDELVRILREELQRGGPTPLWEAASAAMNALENVAGRRVILLFSDGRNSPTFSQAEIEFDDVRERARGSDVMVYAIGLATECDVTSGAAPARFDQARFEQRQRRPRGGRIGGLPIPRLPGIPIGPGGIRMPPPGIFPPPMPVPRGEIDAPPPCRPTTPDPDLRHLSVDSGGGYFVLSRAADLGETFARVADELHHQYLLAFPTPERDGRVHELVVRVRDPETSVRARTSYVAR